MTFHYDDKLTVYISEDIISFFEILKIAGNFYLENGGILVGTLNRGPVLTITDVSTPYPKDVRQRSRFKRVDSQHQSKMDRLWADSGYQKMYLGEWHTHNEDIPSPSSIDISGWLSKANEVHNTPWLVFLILGKHSLRLWTLDGCQVQELIPNGK